MSRQEMMAAIGKLVVSANESVPTREIAGALIAFAVGYARRDGLALDDIHFLVDASLSATSAPPRAS